MESGRGLYRTQVIYWFISWGFHTAENGEQVIAAADTGKTTKDLDALGKKIKVPTPRK